MSSNPTPNLEPVTSPVGVGVISAAQDPTSPNHGSAFAAVIPNTVGLTLAIYTASKPSAVQALLAMAPGVARFQQATALANQGYTIDPYCDAQGYDPVVTMILRTNYQQWFCPPMGANSPIPTPENPDPYQANPGGWIKTSLNPADYPPFYPPAPPAPQKVVGNFQFFNGTITSYGAGPGALAAVAAGVVRDDEPFTEGGVTYTAHVSVGMFGESVSFSVAAQQSSGS